jgi:hypothetical protein
MSAAIVDVRDGPFAPIVRRVWYASCSVLVVALVWSNMDPLGDSFWTMALGRASLEAHALPSHDPFAATTITPH